MRALPALYRLILLEKPARDQTNDPCKFKYFDNLSSFHTFILFLVHQDMMEKVEDWRSKSRRLVNIVMDCLFKQRSNTQEYTDEDFQTLCSFFETILKDAKLVDAMLEKVALLNNWDHIFVDDMLDEDDTSLRYVLYELYLIQKFP